MLQDSTEFQPFSISVSIISGYFLPKPNDNTKGEIVDPFVKVELLTASSTSGTRSEEYKTDAIEDNGFNPVWMDLNKQAEIKPQLMFKFQSNIVTPSLSFLFFTVMDQDMVMHDFLAAAAIPVSCLREGYRLVKLHNYQGADVEFAHLLVYISKVFK